MSIHSAPIDRSNRETSEVYSQQMTEFPAQRLVFLDESGVTTEMARTHGRALRGQRANPARLLAAADGSGRALM